MLEIVNLALRDRGGGDFMQLCILRDIMICEAIFRGRDLIFCGEPHISIYFKDIKSFFNLDNLEPASGHPDPELEVKALKIRKLDVLQQAPGVKLEKKLYR